MPQEPLASPVGNKSGRTLSRILAHPPTWAVLIVCAVALSLRRAGAVTNPQFWAEDSYFFENAYEYGWHAFTIPFAGYLHTLLRAIGMIAASIDPAHARWTYLFCSFAVTLYVASRAVSERSPLPRFCGAAALTVVLVPDTYEVLLNVVNLQWLIGGCLVLLLISGDPVNPRQWIHDLVSAVAMGLTGPFSIVLLPLFLIRAWVRRTRASAWLAAAVGVCALIQEYLVITQPPIGAAKPGFRIAYELLLPAVGRRVGGSVLVGSLLSPDTDQVIGTLVGLATLLGIGLLAWLPGKHRLERALLGLAFLGLLGGSFYRLRYGIDRFFIPTYASRYFYIPQLILMWLLLAAAEVKGLAGRVAPALFACSLLVNLPRYRESAYLVNTRWSVYEPYIREGKPIVVPINPPGWIMPLPARKP
jgi:hypothetical protein